MVLVILRVDRNLKFPLATRTDDHDSWVAVMVMPRVV